jgi:predicted RNA-binding Zn ribbon-like protein
MADSSDAEPAVPRPVGPAHVELLIAYTNTVDAELGTDELTTPVELASWLRRQGLLTPARATGSADDLQLARQLRDALHTAFVANHDGGSDQAALEEVAVALPLRVSAATTGPGLSPVLGGVRGALSQLLVAVNRATGDGTWARVKICAADDCAWAFFDATKNRSRAWCEWGCGNRVKTRNYRARRKAAAAGA